VAIGLPLLDHLRLANRLLGAAARSGSPEAQAAAAAIGTPALGRVRRAKVRGWSQIDGAWATAAQHRALLAQSAALLTRLPSPATADVLAELRRAATSPATVTYVRLPRGVFYPWPRDATFDTQDVVIDVDKPAQVRLTVYAEDGPVVRTLLQDADPGSAAISWDGTSSSGATVAAGVYRYAFDVVDRMGTRIRVPGLGAFRVARDSTAPVVLSGTVRQGARVGGQRRLIVQWQVQEPLSPCVRSWLLLRNGDTALTVRLHDSLQTATVRRLAALHPGTWHATLVFIDGSGNRARHAAGALVVR
jgi:hypothetical protein